MYLLPESLPIGPLNMRVEDLALGAVAFGAAFAFIRAMVLRMNRVLQVREELSTIPEGGIYHDIYLAEQELAALRSGSRHEAARIRQDALEEGASSWSPPVRTGSRSATGSSPPARPASRRTAPRPRPNCASMWPSWHQNSRPA